MSRDMLYGILIGIISMIFLLLVFRDTILTKLISSLNMKVNDEETPFGSVKDFMELQEETEELKSEAISDMLYSYNDYCTIKNVITYFRQVTEFSNMLDGVGFVTDFSRHLEERMKELEKTFKAYGVSDYKSIKREHTKVDKELMERLGGRKDV
jgi:hypothetical protein